MSLTVFNEIAQRSVVNPSIVRNLIHNKIQHFKNFMTANTSAIHLSSIRIITYFEIFTHLVKIGKIVQLFVGQSKILSRENINSGFELRHCAETQSQLVVISEELVRYDPMLVAENLDLLDYC